MAFRFVIEGVDTLDDPHKAIFERQFVLDAGHFVEQLKRLHGVHIDVATASADSQDEVSFIPAPEEVVVEEKPKKVK